MLAATSMEYMRFKAWQVDVAPKENWSTYFDEITWLKNPTTDALSNTYFTTSGGSSDNNGRTTAKF